MGKGRKILLGNQGVVNLTERKGKNRREKGIDSKKGVLHLETESTNSTPSI